MQPNLLITRYEQIIDIPVEGSINNLPKGEIYELAYHGEELFSMFGRMWAPADFDRYPHIWRRMNWWEGRKAEDMPLYLKNSPAFIKSSKWIKNFDQDQVVKVVKHYATPDAANSIDERKNQSGPVKYENCVPATEEEYKAYCQKEKQ